MTIPYGKQYIDRNDIDIVIKSLKSSLLTQGSKVEIFEKIIANYVGCKFTLAVNSASSALQIACMALNIKKGDLVWTTPITFAASANCAINQGAIIDFVDINNKTNNIDSEILEQKLKKSKKIPKLIITVHLSGQPTEQEKIWKLAKKYNFKVIEDASHSLGAMRYNEKVGSCKWSDISVFSFHPVKMITTIEGGMALTNNIKLYNKMNLYRNNGITKNYKFFKKKFDYSWYYEMQENGYNFRMNEIQSALGISQFKKLDKFLIKRNNIAKYYNEKFKLIKDLEIPTVLKDNFSSFHLYILKLKFVNTLKKKSEIMKYLKSKHIYLNVHYIPLHLHHFFKKKGFRKGYLPNAEKYYLEALSLPIFFDLKNNEKRKVVNSIKSILKNG
tara:strand:- start:582 stop:1742 length:1161 start_codon:yes stop_codon:yes gene_type:complete